MLFPVTEPFVLTTTCPALELYLGLRKTGAVAPALPIIVCVACVLTKLPVATLILPPELVLPVVVITSQLTSSANKSSLAYIKNNTIHDLYIDPIGFLIGASTSGTGEFRFEVIKNPTTGTLISNAVENTIVQNKNAGSSKELTADTYKGAEGYTLTNGTLRYASLIPAGASFYAINTGSLILKGGNSLGINITPQTGNTSQDIMIFMSVIEANGSIT